MSGVTAARSGRAPLIRITTERLDPAPAVQAVAGPEYGAVVVFEGRTRDRQAGRRVVRLEYELYPEMVTRELERLSAELVAAHEIGRVAFLVRHGPVPVGETSVVIAVSAPHRQAAFRACEQAIGELKRRVPIWKKEVFEDGSDWV